MSMQEKCFNRIREYRERLELSQAELAARAGISRAAVSAIEGGRLVPSVAAALSLARTFNVSVEELFASLSRKSGDCRWAWNPLFPQQRSRLALHAGELLAYPVEDSPTSFWPHDSVGLSLSPDSGLRDLARRTLVVATCDPAIGLLAQMVWNVTGIRVIAVNRPSRQSLALLGEGKVHAAGVHLSTTENPGENEIVAAEILRNPVSRLRVGTWESGVAIGGKTPPRTLRGLQKGNLTWIGRVAGSGAYRCQQEILGDKSPRRIVRDHEGVVEAIKNGWGEAGITLRWVTEEAGLSFLSIHRDLYEWFFAPELLHDPRMQAILRVLKSPEYQRAASELAGNGCEETGSLG